MLLFLLNQSESGRCSQRLFLFSGSGSFHHDSLYPFSDGGKIIYYRTIQVTLLRLMQSCSPWHAHQEWLRSDAVEIPLSDFQLSKVNIIASKVVVFFCETCAIHWIQSVCSLSPSNRTFIHVSRICKNARWDAEPIKSDDGQRRGKANRCYGQHVSSTRLLAIRSDAPSETGLCAQSLQSLTPTD